ncbi:MAG: cyclic nucleotide-binding domain-containing protein [Rhodoferax sp.]|nr:cyclic nucleotide-binding domain-containing protein [Rhodoferax sp.]
MIFDWTWQLWLGALAGVLLAVSYLLSNIVHMRLLAALAFVLGACSLALFDGQNLWLGALGLMVLAAINLAQVVHITHRAAGIKLSGQERALREWLFPALGDVDFQQLLQVSTRSYPIAGTFLANQGEKLEQLHIIIQGSAHVVANGMVVATLRDGNLIGEVSFFRDDVATASVVAQSDLCVLSVGRTQLRKLMRESEGMQRVLYESIGRDLGFKLTSFDASRF